MMLAAAFVASNVRCIVVAMHLTAECGRNNDLILMLNKPVVRYESIEDDNGLTSNFLA